MIRPDIGLRKTEGIENLHELFPSEEEFANKIAELWYKAEAQLPEEERKCWKVTDWRGNLIRRYATRDEALASAIKRNKRAEEWNLHMRYRIEKDRGFSE